MKEEWKKVMNSTTSPISYAGITNDKKKVYKVIEGKLIVEDWKPGLFISNRPANTTEILAVKMLINKVSSDIDAIKETGLEIPSETKIPSEEKVEYILGWIFKNSVDIQEFNDIIDKVYESRIRM